VNLVNEGAVDGARIPPSMRAVRLHPPGGPEGLVLEEIETPRPQPGEALVRVRAAGITRDELEWPTDRLPAIPSYELSGVVAAIGPDGDGVAIGESVYALTGFDRDGAAADYTAVPAQILAPKPRTLDHVESAAIPLAALTAWQGLFVHGRLEEGQRVLILGASGGVGHLATQLARWSGAYVIGVASLANVEVVRDLGAHEVLDHTTTRLDDAVEPVDLVFDTVGGDVLARSLDVVRSGGRVVSVAEQPPETSTATRTEAAYFVVEPNRSQLAEITRLVESGQLRPSVDSVFPLSEARAAFERSLARGRRGKIVLRVADD
jgi:NADPH:quinone reductase-like Zn-dependent oxidoreductase